MEEMDSTDLLRVKILQLEDKNSALKILEEVSDEVNPELLSGLFPYLSNDLSIGSLDESRITNIHGREFQEIEF